MTFVTDNGMGYSDLGMPFGAKIMVGELYAGYACDESVRSSASSGGIVSAVLIHLLQRGYDGAIVSRITSDGSIRAVTKVVHTSQEVLDHAGSSYIDTPVLQTVKELCKAGSLTGRRYAIVALPCQVRALRLIFRQKPELASVFNPVIGLFCRGNVQSLFYDDLLVREGIDPSQVLSVRVQRGHVRGFVEIRLAGDRKRTLQFHEFNAYRILGIHAKRTCLKCVEHLATEADLSVGDIFLKEFMRLPIKHSAFFASNSATAAMIQSMIDQKNITCLPVGMETYRQRFYKTERFGNDLMSRQLAARIVGRKELFGELPGRFSPFRFLAWIIILLHGRLSDLHWGRWCLYAMPRWWIKSWAIVVKALSRL